MQCVSGHTINKVSIIPPNNNAAHVTTAAEGIRMQRVIWHFIYYGNITISKNIAAHEAAGAKSYASSASANIQAFSKNIAAQEAAAAKVTHTQRVSWQFMCDY